MYKRTQWGDEIKKKMKFINRQKHKGDVADDDAFAAIAIATTTTAVGIAATAASVNDDDDDYKSRPKYEKLKLRDPQIIISISFL